jgi:hypothetical protein
LNFAQGLRVQRAPAPKPRLQEEQDMEKTVIGLVAALGAVAPLAGAQAAVASSEDAANALRVGSVADLLDPVPNSAAILAALDAERKPAAPVSTEVKGLKVAQWHHHHHHYYHHHHHHYYHHHHHHHWYRPGCLRTPVGWVCP